MSSAAGKEAGAKEAPKSAGAAGGGDKGKPVAEAPSALELLEEDDEFEEFQGANWADAAKGEAEEGQLWQDDWDDDDVNDDFAQQLRQQIDANSSGQASAPNP